MAFRTVAVALAAAVPLTAQISHSHLASIQSANQRGEIVAFDASSGRCFVTNPVSAALDVYAASASGGRR